MLVLILLQELAGGVNHHLRKEIFQNQGLHLIRSGRRLLFDPLSELEQTLLELGH